MEIKLLILGAILFVLARVMAVIRPRIHRPAVQKVYGEVYEWVSTGWSAVLLAALLMYFFIQAFKIPSGSMRMTLCEGDHLFVNKCAYGFHVPFSGGKRLWPLREVQRGDIVIFRCPPAALSMSERQDGITKDFVKRCVAIGGDVVQIRNKKVYVNDAPVAGTYASFVDDTVCPSVRVFSTSDQYQRTWESGRFDNLPPAIIRDNFGPIVVPPGHYFVMGDNRDRSFDSRFWGPLADQYVKGRALFIYWPLNRIRLIR
jgi:signal peptidase I